MEKKVNKVPKKQQGGWMDVINQFNPQMMNNINPLLSSFSNAYQAPVAPAKPKASFWQNTNMKRAHQYAVDLKKYNAEKEIYDQSQQILPLLGPMSALFQGQQGYMDYLQKPKDDLTEVSGFHGFQKGGLINTTGYTPGTPSMNNPYNIIPSSNITMQNTPFPILGIANTGEHKVMMPGNNYKFSNADYVAEVPLNKYGGILKKKYQAGGDVQSQEPLFSAVQTEKGEFIGSETGDILPVKAKKRHKNMDDDEVTDILPEGSFIFSRTKSSTIDKNKKIKGIDLNEINLGYTPIKYSETESTPAPEEIKFLDFIDKNKFTPADLAKKLQKEYKITDRGDAFANLSNEHNKMSRIPYLDIIKQINELKKNKDNKYQYGGMVYNHSAKIINGLPINEIQPIPDDGRDPSLERDRKIYSHKNDPYEYMYFNGEIVTRKKNNKGTAWNKINDAGAANLEKWIAEGKYKSYDEDRSVSRIPTSSTQLKTIPAKTGAPIKTKNSANIEYSQPIYRQSDSYNYTVTDENIPGQQNEMGAIASNFMPVYSNIIGMGAGKLAMNGLRSLATRYGGNTAIPVMNRVFNSGRQYPQIGNNTLQLPSPGLTSPGVYSPGIPQPGLPLPGLPMGYQFGGNIFSPQFSQPSNKAIDGIMGYTNPYDLQDKALRKNGLYGPDLLKAPTTLNKNFFNFEDGGEVPNHQLGGIIGGVVNLGLGIYDRYQNNKNVKKTMADIAKYQELANQNAKNTLGIGLGSSLMNYGLQDTGYTFANYDPQISRVNYTGDQIDARLASQMQNSLDANRSLTESAYRNIGSLGLTPGQLSNYMAKLNAQALQNSNAVNAQYNNSIINNLQNRSNLLNQYFDRKALDRQTGYNVMRDNRNVLNSGLTNSFNSLGSNYFNTLSNIEQSSLAAKMGARNQQANFNVNNGLRIGDAATQIGNTVYNNYLQQKAARDAAAQLQMQNYNNFMNQGNYISNGNVYNPADVYYQPLPGTDYSNVV